MSRYVSAIAKRVEMVEMTNRVLLPHGCARELPFKCSPILGTPGNTRTCFPPMHLSARIYLHLSYLKRLTPTRTWQFSSKRWNVSFWRRLLEVSLYHVRKWKYSYTHPQQCESYPLAIRLTSHVFHKSSLLRWLSVSL